MAAIDAYNQHQRERFVLRRTKAVRMAEASTLEEQALKALRRWITKYNRRPTTREWQDAGYWPKYKAIQQVFGSWHAAVAAAEAQIVADPRRSSPSLRPSRSLPQERRDEAVRLWQQGIQQAEIARRLGITRARVGQLRPQFPDRTALVPVNPLPRR